LIAGVLVTGCVSGQLRDPRTVPKSLVPSSTAPVRFTVESRSVLYGAMSVFRNPAVETAVGLARGELDASGRSVLGVGVSIAASATPGSPPLQLDPVVSVSAVRGGSQEPLGTMGSRQPERLVGESVESGVTFLLPRATTAILFTFHVGPTQADAQQGVTMLIPVSRIPVVAPGELESFHPFGISPTY